MKINKDSLIILGVVAAITLVFAVGFFLPQKKQLDGIRGEIVSQKLALTSDGQKAAVVPSMIKSIEQLKTRYRDFDRKLPKRIELGGFLREISSNLTQERLANQLIEPGKPHDEELFNTLPIIMRFDGTYLGLANFLKKIDGMERLTRVQKLAISLDQKPESNSADALRIEVQLNIYFTES